MGKQALITGGTKGIGNAVAECLAKSGYDLLLTYASDTERAKRFQSDLQGKYKINVEILQADASDMGQIEVINSFLEKGDILLDALVLNAGSTCRDSFEKLQMEDW